MRHALVAAGSSAGFPDKILEFPHVSIGFVNNVADLAIWLWTNPIEDILTIAN